MRSLILALVMLAPALVSAAPQIRQVQCRFISFGSDVEPAPVVAISGEGAEVSCPLSTTQISPKIVCAAKDNVIGFVTSADKRPIATATIPPEISSAFLVFVKVPAKPEASPWRVVVFEDSAKNFPDGGAFVANFHSQDIRFIIGEHKGMLHAAGYHGYSMPKQRDSFNMAPVTVEFLQDKKWRTASESSLRFLPGMAYLIFAFVDPASGRPRVATYQDFGTARDAPP
jgi:hypothetical protein